MFILSFIPTWLFYFITVAGIGLFCVSLFASQIPVVKQYGLAAQILAGFLIIFGIYFIGASDNQTIWEEKVAKLERKMQDLENVQPIINEVIKREYIDKPIEVITERTKTIIQKIPQVITEEVDNRCMIPRSVVELHNEAVE